MLLDKTKVDLDLLTNLYGAYQQLSGSPLKRRHEDGLFYPSPRAPKVPPIFQKIKEANYEVRKYDLWELHPLVVRAVDFIYVLHTRREGIDYSKEIASLNEADEYLTQIRLDYKRKLIRDPKE